jgi:hypothetical protein
MSARSQAGLAGLLLAVAVLSTHATAWGAFVNGVETFDGNVMDTATWEGLARFSGSTIAQNNAMILHGPYAADYTTRSLTVGIGQKVQVDVTMTSPPPSGYDGWAALVLTTNDQGTAQQTNHDSATLWNVLQTWPDGTDSVFVMHQGDGYGNYYATGLPLLGVRYTLSLERLSATSVKSSLSDANGLARGSYTLTDFTDVPSDLYVSLYVQAMDATFDNVVVTPEPATLSLLALGGLALLRRRRNR